VPGNNGNYLVRMINSRIKFSNEPQEIWTHSDLAGAPENFQAYLIAGATDWFNRRATIGPGAKARLLAFRRNAPWKSNRLTWER
jgi:hypothetical protein